MFLRIFKTAIFLVIIGCRFFYWCHGCLEEERTHLLQIKDSINYPHGSSLDEAWVEKDCCNWDGIECNSSRVISISLFSKREERLGVWYPNASLFVPFKELEQLYLGGNQIGGWVTPQAFSKMQSLRNLYLGRNNLSAGINSLRGLCELKNLQVLSLEDNNLDGRVLPPCLSNLSMLEELSLSDNDLGPYSSALTALSGMRSLKLLDLSSNNLSGGTDSLRGLCELKNLQDLHLEKNNLDGRALPPCLSNLSMLKNLRLSGNDLGSYSSALTGICKLPALRLLDLSGNRLNDHSIPKCLGNLSLLEKLYLSHNELRGSFSSLTGLCELSALGTLYLDNNYLTSLPICMGNFSSLERLILQGNNLSSLFGNSVPGLKRLLVLNLGSNLLTDDSISPWIYNLTSLTVLELSNNTLRGSNTMRGFCNLRNLEELDIEGNSFECSLHPCFDSFQNLGNIESLDLSHNQLVGMIPAQIVRLYSLSIFNVAFNNLSGVIPNEKQFLTFSESSYIGNHDLCGPPLQQSCSSNNQSQTRDSEREEEDNVGILDHPIVFYLVVVISYALGFWSIIALLFNKTWRQKLFRFVDSEHPLVKAIVDYARHYHCFGKLPTAEDTRNQRKEANVSGWLHDVFEFSALPGKGGRCFG
ncbi:hypothetical protein MRB53_031399 [Persea americana]|uniref:Uncharacterized protein n=1 Tax=Persea americana TaxID=3435 RepID=A0ACC2KPB9_PERAE|nr:hypothetical protein MRB53_031399 [Persea americana]